MTSVSGDYTGPADLCRPFIWTLPLARRTLLFTDLHPSDVNGKAQAFRLIQDAARRADNVGTDEIPSEDFFNWFTSYAHHVVAIRDVSTSEDAAIIGLLLWQPCYYVRSYHASNFMLLMVTGESISSRLVWRDLARLGFEIGIRSERCYTACTIDVFVTCSELVAALREEGFVITAVIPHAGLVNGFPGRHIDSYVMYKELNTPPKPLLLTPSTEFSDDNDGDIPDDVKLLEVSYLPVTFVLADGTPIIIRGLRNNEEELRSYYCAFKEAAATGDGYGIDELPSLGYFVRWYVSDFYNLVFELAPDASREGPTAEGTTGRTVAYVNFGPSLFSRSVNNSVLADGNIVILPEFRNRRWGTEIQRIQFGISYDVGLRHTLGGTSTKNLRALMSIRKLGSIATGSVPRCIYFKDVGWTDSITLYREVTESFQEMLQQQRSEQQLVSKL